MTVIKTADVCKRFDIGRNTRFRWEEQGLIPCAQRNVRGEREFSDEDPVAIARFIQLQRHAARFGRVVYGNGAGRHEQIYGPSEEHSLFKFTHLDDPAGLEKLKQYRPLQDKTIVALLDYARARCTPQDPLFWDILQTVLATSGPPARRSSRGAP